MNGISSVGLTQAVKSALVYGSSTPTQTLTELYARIETLISKIGDIEKAEKHLRASKQETPQDIADIDALLQILAAQAQKTTQQIVKLKEQQMAAMETNSATRLALLSTPTSSVEQATDLMNLIFHGQAPPTSLLSPPGYA